QDDPTVPGKFGESGKYACISCHAPNKQTKDPITGQVTSITPLYFIDTRSAPSNVSSGAAKYTKHNAMSLINIGFKTQIAERNCVGSDDVFCTHVFSWTGVYDTPANVLQLAGLKAMNSNITLIAHQVAANPIYVADYRDAFDEEPAQSILKDDLQRTFDNVGRAFEAYARRLNTKNSRFDQYVTGDHDAL